MGWRAKRESNILSYFRDTTLGATYEKATVNMFFSFCPTEASHYKSGEGRAARLGIIANHLCVFTFTGVTLS